MKNGLHIKNYLITINDMPPVYLTGGISLLLIVFYLIQFFKILDYFFSYKYLNKFIYTNSFFIKKVLKS